MWKIDMLVTHPSPHFGALARSSTPEVLWTKERTPTPYPSVAFTFGFAIESIKELGGESINMSLHGKKNYVKNIQKGDDVSQFWYILKNLDHVMFFTCSDNYLLKVKKGLWKNFVACLFSNLAH